MYAKKLSAPRNLLVFYGREGSYKAFFCGANLLWIQSVLFVKASGKMWHVLCSMYVVPPNYSNTVRATKESKRHSFCE